MKLYQNICIYTKFINLNNSLTKNDIISLVTGMKLRSSVFIL